VDPVYPVPDSDPDPHHWYLVTSFWIKNLFYGSDSRILKVERCFKEDPDP
jgi:hypothetical protein